MTAFSLFFDEFKGWTPVQFQVLADHIVGEIADEKIKSGLFVFI